MAVTRFGDYSEDIADCLAQFSWQSWRLLVLCWHSRNHCDSLLMQWTLIWQSWLRWCFLCCVSWCKNSRLSVRFIGDVGMAIDQNCCQCLRTATLSLGIGHVPVLERRSTLQDTKRFTRFTLLFNSVDVGHEIVILQHAWCVLYTLSVF